MKRTTVALAALSLASMAQAASYDLNTSFAGWLTSVGSAATLGTATFANSSGNAVVSGVPGLTYTVTQPGSASFASGGLQHVVSGSDYLEWTLPGFQNGFGGSFKIADGNSGVAIVAKDRNLGWIDVCSACFGVSAGPGTGAYDGFFGFSSASQFDAVRVFAASGGGSTYVMTDVSIAAVPEPSSYAMMALGLAGLGWLGARRRRAAA